jgi:hypothetical protein
VVDNIEKRNDKGFVHGYVGEMAEQVRCGVTARSRPARGGAGPDRGPEALPIAGTRPAGRAGPRGKRP